MQRADGSGEHRSTAVVAFILITDGAQVRRNRPLIADDRHRPGNTFGTLATRFAHQAPLPGHD